MDGWRCEREKEKECRKEIRNEKKTGILYIQEYGDKDRNSSKKKIKPDSKLDEIKPMYVLVFDIYVTHVSMY